MIKPVMRALRQAIFPRNHLGLSMTGLSAVHLLHAGLGIAALEQ